MITQFLCVFPDLFLLLFKEFKMQKQKTFKQGMLIAVRGLYVLATATIVIMSLSVMSGQ